MALSVAMTGPVKAEDSATVYLDKGMALVEAKQFDEALVALTKAIDLDPTFSQAHMFRAIAYASLMKIKAFSEDIDTAIRLDDQNADALTLRGILKYNQRKYDAAIADLTASLELDAESATAYEKRGASYYFQRNYNAAISDLTAAIDLNPTLAEAFFLRGRAYGGLYEPELVLKDHEEALRLEPSNLKYRLWRAKSRVFFMGGDDSNFNQVVSDLEMVIEAKQENADAYFVRATAYAFACRFEEAIRYQKQAISIVENDPDQTVWGRYYEKLSKFEAHDKGYCMSGFKEQ